MFRIASAIIALFLCSLVAFADTASSCSVVFPPETRNPKNIFSPAQEVDLGDAIAESQLLGIPVLAESDPMLQKIAERLVRTAPLRDLRIRTFIVDIPEANAFTIPGGRVYVSRALIALAQSEDELSGVMAHEFGHLLAHQQATEISLLLKASLGVTELSGRRQIFDAFSRLLESTARVRVPNKEEADQMEADRLGLLIQAAAGYDPEAQIRAFDRLAQTKGNTGTFLSDLFHFTTPESKRLREMLKSVPEGCSVPARPQTDEFAAWRKQMLANTKTPFPESLHGILSRRILSPPISGDLRQIRFSPDGQYVLAQDTSGVTVLSSRPFAVLFRALALRASFAEFTPDSRELVFVSSGTHIERWSVTDHERTDISEIPLRDECATEKLSPDGRILACVDAAGKLTLFDTASAEAVFEKERFGRPLELSLGRVSITLRYTGAAAMDFSPDAHYFIAVPEAAEGSVIAWDCQQRTPVSIGGGLKKLQNQHFAFIAPNRVVVAPLPGREPANVNGSILEFPSGSPISSVLLPPGQLSRAADPGFVIVHTPGKLAVAAVELRTGRTVGSKVDALDEFGENYVAERLTGEVGSYQRGQAQAVFTAQLPQAELSDLRAASISPDFGWLAASAETVAAVWDLTTGNARARFGAVDGFFFDADQRLIVDVPKDSGRERHIVEIDNIRKNSVSGPDLAGLLAEQTGPWVLVTRTEQGMPPTFDIHTGYFEDVIYEVRDAITGKIAWSKQFRKQAPHRYCGADGRYCLFVVAADTSTGAEMIHQDAALKDAVGSVKLGKYLVETVDLATGESKARTVINLVNPSLRIRKALPAGDRMVIQDSRNRVLVFAKGSSEASARIFGHLLAADPARGRLAVATEPGQVVIYDAANGEQIDEFRFPARLMMTRFREDGRSMFALTSTQEAITLAIP